MSDITNTSRQLTQLILKLSLIDLVKSCDPSQKRGNVANRE